MGAPVRVGDVLADKFEVTKILGSGGMGVVVAARHRELDKLVALKFMHEEMAANEQAIDRFLREARAAARLRSEHIGHVLDVGRLANGAPYIVLEYLEGQDLGELLAKRGPLEVAEAVEYVLQTCEAMAEAHAQGIIHRDLKPQNLFLTMRADGRPFVKVLDFGISKAQYTEGLTATKQAMGTPSYMAPEQMRSARSVDGRADIWSIGVILFELLSATLPFSGETITEVMLKVISEPAPTLTNVRRDVPITLARIVDRCLAKDREQRFPNVAALVQELIPFAPERARAAIALIERVMSAGAAAPRLDTDLGPTIPGSTSRVPTAAAFPTTLGAAASSMSAHPTPRSRWRWVVVVTAAALVVVAIGFVANRARDTTPSSTIDEHIPSGLSPADATVDTAVAEHQTEVRDAPDHTQLGDATDAVLEGLVDARRPDTHRASTNPLDGGRSHDAQVPTTIPPPIDASVDAAVPIEPDAAQPDAFVIRAVGEQVPGKKDKQ